jgi:hypothetical protein
MLSCLCTGVKKETGWVWQIGTAGDVALETFDEEEYRELEDKKCGDGGKIEAGGENSVCMAKNIWVEGSSGGTATETPINEGDIMNYERVRIGARELKWCNGKGKESEKKNVEYEHAVWMKKTK